MDRSLFVSFVICFPHTSLIAVYRRHCVLPNPDQSEPCITVIEIIFSVVSYEYSSSRTWYPEG